MANQHFRNCAYTAPEYQPAYFNGKGHNINNGKRVCYPEQGSGKTIDDCDSLPPNRGGENGTTILVTLPSPHGVTGTATVTAAGGTTPSSGTQFFAWKADTGQVTNAGNPRIAGVTPNSTCWVYKSDGVTIAHNGGGTGQVAAGDVLKVRCGTGLGSHYWCLAEPGCTLNRIYHECPYYCLAPDCLNGEVGNGANNLPTSGQQGNTCNTPETGCCAGVGSACQLGRGPKGCAFHRGNLYYNIHPQGAVSSQAAPVCKCDIDDGPLSEPCLYPSCGQGDYVGDPDNSCVVGSQAWCGTCKTTSLDTLPFNRGTKAGCLAAGACVDIVLTAEDGDHQCPKWYVRCMGDNLANPNYCNASAANVEFYTRTAPGPHRCAGMYYFMQSRR